MMSFPPGLTILRDMQRKLMLETCDIYRNGVLVASFVPCRVHSNRLFAENPDPQDANMRSFAEWGFTVPLGTDVRVADEIEQENTGRVIVGEVVTGDTWQTAIRVWATKPKTATPTISVVLYRWNQATETYTARPVQDVQIVYDRNEAEETPIRYVPAGRSYNRSGWLIGTTTFDVALGDRFTIDGIGAMIIEIMPHQPSRKEAKFSMDLGGVR